MKANVLKIMEVVANLLTWALTGINYRRRAKRCLAYKRGWCCGQYCGSCAGPVTQPPLNEENDEHDEQQKTERKEEDAS